MNFDTTTSWIVVLLRVVVECGHWIMLSLYLSHHLCVINDRKNYRYSYYAVIHLVRDFLREDHLNHIFSLYIFAFKVYTGNFNNFISHLSFFCTILRFTSCFRVHIYNFHQNLVTLSSNYMSFVALALLCV